MDIDKLEARELDARVATEVMGWKEVSLPDVDWFVNKEYEKLTQPIFYLIPNQGISFANSIGFRPFHPSTSIAAAWAVVEKMKEEHEPIKIVVWETHTHVFIGEDELFIHAPTAPLAICRAALRAVAG